MINKTVKIILCLHFAFTGLFSDDAISCKDDNYFIPYTYSARTVYVHWDDTPMKDECQDEVYATANQLRLTHRYDRIADIGCGSGYKLIKYLSDCHTVGFEIEPTLSFLCKKYTNREWELVDFASTNPNQSDFDIVICADVIEHLVDPDQLLNYINKMNFHYLVISTPDRYLLGDAAQKGPPENPAHVREWGYDEFEKYISAYFEVVDHHHTHKEFWGQTIVCRKRL